MVLKEGRGKRTEVCRFPGKRLQARLVERKFKFNNGRNKVRGRQSGERRITPLLERKIEEGVEEKKTLPL